jgi:adenylyltransferase/sulfurtransferase
VAFVEITPRDLQARLEHGEELQLIDVRERFEWDVARLPGARLVPFGTLPEALETLDRDRAVVVYCKGGTRGRVAASYLADSGFQRVANLAGGIARWSQEVDPSLRPY